MPYSSDIERNAVQRGLAGCAPLPSVPATAVLSEVVTHLKCALGQSIATDDQTIIGHVRSAHELAVLLLRQAQRNAA